MEFRKENVFLLISLGSPAFSSAYLTKCISISNNSVGAITLIALNEHEVKNRVVLYQESIQVAMKVVTRQVNELIKKYSCIAEIVRSSDLRNSAEFCELEAKIQRSYDENASVKKYIHNEVFRNLDPKLRMVGVCNSRDWRVETLAPYLLHEIAVYAWLANTGRYTDEILPQKRSKAILEKFLSRTLLERLDHIKQNVLPSESRKNLLDAEGITLFGKQERLILDSINLTVPEGEIVGLVGPNGSGKTSLLKVLAGHIPLSKGKVTIDGQNVTNSASRFRHVSTVFQNPKLLPGHSVAGNLRLFSESSGMKKEVRDQMLKEVVNLLDLTELMEKAVEKLSGGESQKVAIARSFVSGAALLLLDEPGSALDISSRIKLMRSLAQLIKYKKEPYYPRGAIVVAHDPDLIAAICDEVAVVDLGRIIRWGSTSELIRNPKYVSAASHLCPGNTLTLEFDEAGIVVEKDLALMTKNQLMEIQGSKILESINPSDRLVYLHVPTTALYFGIMEGMLKTKPLTICAQKPRANSFEIFFADSEHSSNPMILGSLPYAQRFPVTSELSIDLMQCSLLSDHKH